MKVLLIGAAGMLGRELTDVFKDQQLIEGDLPDYDITDYNRLSRKITNDQPDLVINCAAYTDVEGAETHPEQAFKVNAEGVKNLAKICRTNKIKLVHLSTEYVFNGDSKDGYNENAQTAALNIYGKSKEQGEKYLQNYGQDYYLVRSSWLYGAWPQKGKPRGKNFIDKILELAETQNEIRVVDDQFGKPTFTKDLADYIKKLVFEKTPYGIYHLVNERVASWYDFAKEALTIMNHKTIVKPIRSVEYPSQVIRPKYAILINTKFSKLRTWPEALEEYLLTKKL